MERFGNNSYALGLKVFLNGIGDLACHALLNLQPAGKHLDDAG